MTETAIHLPSSTRSRRRFPTAGSLAPWIATLLLLCGVAFDRIMLQRPTADTAEYHESIQRLAEAIPMMNGMWTGVEQTVPQGALAMLKPNVMISRKYTEIGTGRQVQLLLVQCKDARDIDGHYPPVCYKGRGCVEDSGSREEPHWTVGDITVNLTHYVFITPQHRRLTIENFMVLPSGKTAKDMDAVEDAAQDQRQKYFGAAQVQLLYDTDVPAAERKEIFDSFVGMLKPLLHGIMRQSPTATEGENRL